MFGSYIRGKGKGDLFYFQLTRVQASKPFPDLRVSAYRVKFLCITTTRNYYYLQNPRPGARDEEAGGKMAGRPAKERFIDGNVSHNMYLVSKNSSQIRRTRTSPYAC